MDLASEATLGFQDEAGVKDPFQRNIFDQIVILATRRAQSAGLIQAAVHPSSAAT
jgi:hypothetical protein